MRPIPPPPGMEGGPQQIQFQQIAKSPPSRMGGMCENCIHWQRDQAKRVVQVVGGGQVVVSELIKAGMKLPPADHIALVSLCAFNPMWNATTDDHWCGQFDIGLTDAEAKAKFS